MNTDDMTHAERLKAMRAKRFAEQDAASGVPGNFEPTGTELFGARIADADQRSLATVNGGGIGERPSSKVLAPPGGRSSITLG